MALYEYSCSKCDHSFERIMKTGARAPRCPECGSSTKRLISAPAIHFKGSGWYVTDYARKGKEGKSGGKKAETGSAADSGSKDTTKKKSDKKNAAGGKSTDKK